MINISVLNSDLGCIGILDKYSSFIWTDRYNDAGDFELCLPVNAKYAQSIKEDMFLSIPTSDRTMIVESIKIITDSEEGNTYNITGRSLESILNRRIVWKQTQVSGSVQNAIHLLIDDAIINPTDARRQIPNFRFIESTDPKVTSVNYTQIAQYKGDTLFDVIKKVCQAFHLGFKIELHNGYFDFQLFAGTNRSYSQTGISYVVFSPNNDNLLNSNFLKSVKNYKNVLRIAGQGEGATQTEITHYLEFDDDNASEITGLARREIYVDCHDVSSVTSSNTVMDVQQYTNTLVQKGVEKLTELVPETAFEGEIDATINYKYEVDYSVGDICEIQNEFGMRDEVRVSEVVQTWEADGYTCIPTLESISSEDIDYASSSSDAETIVEIVETTSKKIETAGLAIKWKDIYGSSEDATITYLSHSDVRMTTQLMGIKYYASTNHWRITFLKDNTAVYDKINDITSIYNRMMTVEWSYSQLVNYEVSHTA